ncbi:DNA-binding IclR family transcriptional regulator [Microbacterium sp. W4I4]|uniref:IclR family transcriptional regulator n=1 Tax=Microbacterium sp. W4I4 TaxID=3042295 RepID=UPI002787BC73|nr:IclR family transcriptional regulator [Microbacterium sp. W4I4]MDQ0614018.1 DNA-binding IclR family transcriptional regulator [Microbacterium sp. W4I4]
MTAGAEDGTGGEHGTVGALDRAIRIIDELAGAPDGLDLASVAKAVGMSASGAHRALKSLVIGGVVAQRERRGEYYLGPKILVWAQQMKQDGALATLAAPMLRDLNGETGESVYLSVVRDSRIWNIVWLSGRGQIVVHARPGSESNFHSTGRGKLFLAYMPKERARTLIHSTGLPKVGPSSITDETVLWEQVAHAHELGYAVSREESFAGGAGVAAPVLGVDGTLLATIGVSVPLVRFESVGEQYFVDRVRAAASKIEEAVTRELMTGMRSVSQS